MSIWSRHALFERHSLALILGIVVMVSIGGIVQIAPTWYLESTIEKVEGVRPYTPLELAGRNIYIREGCYVCHSQMVRPLRDEVERYGHYSLAAESMYDRPFQWGSKRTGPDLARVGGKYSDEWHRDHLISPQALVPESVMPPYAFLADRALDVSAIEAQVRANKLFGVPYSEEMAANAKANALDQADAMSDTADQIAADYPKANVRDFDGDPKRVTEMDALIAYLQSLGANVDFKTYDAAVASNIR
jgi:cytochrome c oxidase cbb3-type subunit II